MVGHQPRETRGPIETYQEQPHKNIFVYQVTSRAKRAALLKLKLKKMIVMSLNLQVTSRAKRAALLKLPEAV